MATIHISEAEAAHDLAGLLARVRAGAEVVIDKDDSPAVVLHVAAAPNVRRLSMARERHSIVTLDSGFADDLEAVILSHPEPLQSTIVIP